MSMSFTTAAATPSRSASAIIADMASGYHLLKIDGYSRTKGTPTGESIKSRQFSVGGHRWHIDYRPNGSDSDSADYISLFLYLDSSAATPVKAKHRFSFVGELEEQARSSVAAEGVYDFATNGAWGTKAFIKREELEESEHLRDDSFTVRCDVIVINDYRTEDSPDDAPAFVSVPPSDLHQHLRDLLRTEKGADVVLEVGGETFAAHRCVLAARSPVFGTELFGAMKEGDGAAGAGGVVRIDDMEAQVFRALLCFVYTDSLPETKREDENAMCQHLLVAADRYDMERLKLICEAKLCSHIDVGTVATTMALAEQHHCDGLKKACFSFLGSPANLKEVMASDEFQHLYRSCPAIIKELITLLAPV